jgi:hypothetical protein
MRGLQLEGLKAAVGKLKLIGKGRPPTTLTNASICSAAIQAANHTDPRDSLAR